METIYYIYKITCTLNQKIYIGQRKTNKWPDSSYLGSGLLIKRAIKKYGKEYFKKEILEICTDNLHLNIQEIEWIKKLDCLFPKGFNISPGGTNICDLRYHPERDRICKDISNTLKKYYKEHPITPEFAKSRAKRLIGIKKPPHTEEAKAKIRYARSLQKAPSLGFKFSEESKKKMSDSHKGKVSGKKGKKCSQAFIDSISILVVCPFCNKEGKYMGMNRWHFNNCKNKPI